MTAGEVLERLRELGSEHNRQGMARFGINTARALGVSMASMRPLAREFGREHELAQTLWDTKVHEARILACLIDDPKKAGRDQLERWVEDLDSWDLTDQFCNKLAVKTPLAWELAVSWAAREEEFVRRAGYSLMAQLAVHHKAAPDRDFLPLLELVEGAADDERNFVKKAVNWALRQIGKRSPALRVAAVETARRLVKRESKSARWIARDALRELDPA
ncbi:DNA alkylation repair protein [Fundidesulfovibrio putealis]|uniref:DNA alkylation repair protein n=1 Tax=Fundidesulfovibrio putealis TaxID=270496 RepID=UPI000413D016|nr:DNA alkylation repair protein [Fundidesulfovibrio putealis]